jgi:membrane-associated protein
METVFNFACQHAYSAHWIIFLLLMLAGLNVPISEDLLLLAGGTIASTCIPHHTLRLFTWIYFGCWISAWEAYWVGRLLGPKLYDIRWFSRVITPRRITLLHHYYEKFGVLTFIVGRFIPGGIRNSLFMTAGLGKMPFFRFIIRDGIACSFSSTTIFSIGFYFGENYHRIIHYFKTYNYIAFGCIAIILLLVGIFIWRKRHHKTSI